MSGVLLGIAALSAVPASPASAATPAFVQVKAKEITSGTSVSATFDAPNTAGNLLVVYVAWSNTSPVTVTDTRGNIYSAAASATVWRSGIWSSQVFYAQQRESAAPTR